MGAANCAVTLYGLACGFSPPRFVAFAFSFSFVFALAFAFDLSWGLLDVTDGCRARSARVSRLSAAVACMNSLSILPASVRARCSSGHSIWAPAFVILAADFTSTGVGSLFQSLRADE